MLDQKLHYDTLASLGALENQDGVHDGRNKQENSIQGLNILTLLCLRYSFYVVNNTIVLSCFHPV